MLPEIWISKLDIVFVGTCIANTSDELGFYYLGPNNQFWSLLEYTKISTQRVVTKVERQALKDAYVTGRLTDELKTMFFQKKQDELLKQRIGLTDLNRRIVVSSDDDSKAYPTRRDIDLFVGKVKKLKPRSLAFVTSLDIFEECFKPLFQPATRNRGRQLFRIDETEVWLLGSTSGRAGNQEAREEVFEELARFLITLRGSHE